MYILKRKLKDKEVEYFWKEEEGLEKLWTKDKEKANVLTLTTAEALISVLIFGGRLGLEDEGDTVSIEKVK